MLKGITLLYVVLLAFKVAAQSTLVPFNSAWRYLDNGTDQGTGWRAASFDDSSWKTGTGKFGYGESGLSTVVSFGPDASNKFITTYFRKTVTISDAGAYTSFTGSLYCDDGLVVYVNGVEVHRYNLPTGSISYTTLAFDASDDGEDMHTFTISPSAFVSGTNILAVEVHQSKLNTSDMVFDLALSGTAGVLPQVTQNSLTVSTSGSGAVTKSPDQDTFDSGSIVSLTATPASGYTFAGWSGDASGTTNPLAVTMNGNLSITANFVAVSSEQQVTGFVLIDSNTEQEVKPISDGAVISLASLPSSKVNIRAVTSPPSVGSVVFELSGTQRKTYTDRAAPYALHGDDGSGNYYYGNWNPPATGSYTLKATPYSGSDGSGTPGIPLTISFTIVERDLTPPAVVSISRQAPAASTTDTTSVVYRATFSEKVSGVDAADFVPTVTAGALVASVFSVVAVGSGGTTYDISVSSIAGDGVLRLDLKASGTGIADAEGNTISSGFTGGESYTIRQDLVAPVVLSINRQLPASDTTDATAVTFRVTFSEQVSGVDTSDFALAITGVLTGSIDSVAAADTTGTSYYITVSSVRGNGMLRLDLEADSTGITDTAGNVLSSGFTGGESYTIRQDVVAPVVLSITRQSPAADSTEAAAVTFRAIFSEGVSGVDISDFGLTISGPLTGTIDTVAAIDTLGTTYDITVGSVSGNGILRLDLKSGGTGVADAAGNAIEGGFTEGENYKIWQDLVAPTLLTISRKTPAADTTDATAVTFRATFSEAVRGVDAADFSLSLTGNLTGVIEAVTAADSTGAGYNIAVNAIAGDGELRLDLNASGTGITDAVGHAISSGNTTGETYTVLQAPVVKSINRLSPAADSTDATVVTFRVTFSEVVKGVDASDFTLAVSGKLSGTIDSVAAADTTGVSYDITVSPVLGDGKLRLDLKAASTNIADAVGINISGGFTSGESYTIRQDVTGPVVTSVSRLLPAADSTDAVSVTFRAIFSEEVIGVDAADFSVVTTGMLTGVIDSVAVVASDSTTFDITVGSIAGNGKLRLDLNASGTGISDAVGNAITGGFTTGESYTIRQDVVAPVVLSINRHAPATTVTSATTVTFRATFSESVSGVDRGDFTFTAVSGGVSGVLAPNAVAAVGTGGVLYDITVSALTGSGTVRLDLKADSTGILDAVGNSSSGGYTSGQTYVIDPTVPQVMGFVLIDANTEREVKSVSDGEVISLSSLPSAKVNIRAITTVAPVGSVIFELSGTQSKTYTDKAAPYALHGDNGSGNYYYGNWNPPATGSYTLKATPYSGSDGSGTAGLPLIISFTFVEQGGQSGSGPGILTRGPYLQMGNQTAMTLRWRTSTATDSRIEVGTTFGAYTLSATNPTVTTEHEVRISGLTPGTRYYYRFGSSSQVLQADQSNFFNTAPPANTTGKIRIAAFGDCGADDNGNRTGSLNSYLTHTGSNPAELMLLLGDNAYQDGTDADYQNEFFTPYSSTILKNHVLFPAPGNHEYREIALTERNAGGYYKSFSMPTAGECGGVPSGSKAFYSFDWGNIHFISLDSYGVEALDNTKLYDTLGVQVQWLKKDLAANSKKWVIAYWHHPPHTKGSHNSDTEGELIRLRQNFIRILERHGVDLVLTGHSHNYERSYLLNNYYGTEASFNLATHTKSTSSGKYNGSANSCVYVTASGTRNHGTVYVVEGSSGNSGSVQSGYPHNALPFAVNDGGMLYLEVEDNRLDCKMLRKDGTIFDQFTIMQDVNKTTTIGTAPGNQVQLTASWVGTYRWSNGATTRSITVSPSASTVYSVSDAYNCLTDVFNVNTEPMAANAQSQLYEEDPTLAQSVIVSPTEAKRGTSITVQLTDKEITEAFVTDERGNTLQSYKFSEAFLIETTDLPAGTYYVNVIKNQSTAKLKILITD